MLFRGILFLLFVCCFVYCEEAGIVQRTLILPRVSPPPSPSPRRSCTIRRRQHSRSKKKATSDGERIHGEGAALRVRPQPPTATPSPSPTTFARCASLPSYATLRKLCSPSPTPNERSTSAISCAPYDAAAALQLTALRRF